MTEQMWQRTDNWVGSQIDDAFVMIDIDVGSYLSLNRSATEIWSALEQPVTAAAIVERLTGRFDVPADAAAASVERTLGNLLSKGLIKAVA
jgi:hypothetical protein